MFNKMYAHCLTCYVGGASDLTTLRRHTTNTTATTTAVTILFHNNITLT